MNRTRNGWHTPTYYKVRSTVRFAFWWSLAMGTVLVGKWLVDVGYGDQRPSCPVVLEPDFTWTRSNTDFSLTDCRPPQNVVLYNNGTWGWEN